MILLPVISLLLGILYFSEKLGRFRQSIMASAIIHFAFILISSEILGALNLFSEQYIALSWLLPTLTWILLTGKNIPAMTSRTLSLFTEKARELKGFNSWIISMLATLAVLTLLIAASALPNNWDSMTYHLPRIIFWLQNHNISHFPTEDYRMLFNPPLSELAMAHIRALGGGFDQFMNLVQWSAYLLLMLSAASTAEVLGAGLRGQLISALLTATIPGLVMQAETTQNDLLTGALMLASFHFLMASIRQWSAITWGLGIISAGLALATKATAFMFLPFILAVPAFLALRQRRFIALAALALIILPSAGWLGRNYVFFGNPLGYENERYMSQNINSFRNEYFSPPQAASSLAKNLSLFTATPSASINRAITQIIRKFSNTLGINPDDKKFTWPHSKYSIPLTGPHEDSAPAFWHFLLVLSVLGWMATRKNKHEHIASLYVDGCIMAGFIASCIYIKWMPWNGRFLVLWAAIFIAASGQAWERWPIKTVNTLCVLFFFAAIPFAIMPLQRSLFNWSIESSGLKIHFTSVFTHDTATRYMAGKLALAEPLNEITRAAASEKPSCIGIIKGGGDLALYPLMAMLQKELSEVKLSFADARNKSAALAAALTPQMIVAFGATLPNQDTITTYKCIFRNNWGSVWKLSVKAASDP